MSHLQAYQGFINKGLYSFRSLSFPFLVECTFIYKFHFLTTPKHLPPETEMSLFPQLRGTFLLPLPVAVACRPHKMQISQNGVAPSLPHSELRMVSEFHLYKGPLKPSGPLENSQPPLSRWGLGWPGCLADCVLRSPPREGCDLYAWACHRVKGRATFSF